MMPDRWAAISKELEALLALDADQRREYLDRLARQSPELAAETQAYLVHENALNTSDHAWRSPDSEIDLSDRWVGRVVGDFRLDELIGKGGSSLVYRATRLRFAQSVAIKILRNVDAGGWSRRFAQERDVLARLQHPRIATLYDAGCTDDGLPYLVLELVDGSNWHEWLKTSPSRADQIKAFLAVCDAVRFAHQRLIIHRDIKPANIIIDRTGQPKLLDFGIARLIAPEAPDITRDAGRAYTPAYASPEQVAGQPVTTTADVHALGVLLYETLTGCNPFSDPGSDIATINAVATRVPDPPSKVASQRGREPIAKDLDVVILKALAKDPHVRYASVDALASDVAAAFDGRPVLARAPTFGYLAARWVSRHRTASALSALALAGTVGFAALATWQARVAIHQRERAEAQSAQVRAFARNLMFDYHASVQKLAGSLPLQRRLVQDALASLAKLQADSAGDPGLAIEIAQAYMRIGDVQGNPYAANLGDFASARKSYGQAQAQLAKLEPAQADGSAARLLAAQLMLREGHLDAQDAQLADAERRYRQALSALRSLGRHATGIDASLELCHALDHLGDLLMRYTLKGGDEARQLHIESLALRQALAKTHGEDSRVASGLYHSALREGDHWLQRNDMAQAEAAFTVALKQIESLAEQAPDDTYRQRERALVHSRLVQVSDSAGQINASITHAVAAMRIMEKLLAADPKNEAMRGGVSAARGWAARQLIKADRYAEAAPVVAALIEISQIRLKESPDNADFLDSLARAYRREGELAGGLKDYPRAIAAHRAALAIQIPLASRGPDYALAAALSHGHIGRSELARGRAVAARASLREATQMIQNTLDAHPGAHRFWQDLAECYAHLGDAWLAMPANPRQAKLAYQQSLDALARMAANSALSPAANTLREAVMAKAARV